MPRSSSRPVTPATTDSSAAASGGSSTICGHAASRSRSPRSAAPRSTTSSRRSRSRPGRSAGSPIAFRTDITGLIQQQDTPRFGILNTEGFTVAGTRQFPRWNGTPAPSRSARTTTSGFAPAASMRCARSARTWTRPRFRSARGPARSARRSSGSSGSIVTHQLAPLAAEAGFRLEAQVVQLREPVPARPGHVHQGLGVGFALHLDRHEVSAPRRPPLRPGHPAGRRRAAPRGRALLRRRRLHRPRLLRRSDGHRARPGRGAAAVQHLADPRDPRRRQHPRARQPRRAAPHLQDPCGRGVRRRRHDHQRLGHRRGRRHPALGGHGRSAS